jgi:two-component system, OmpR family, response regulator
MMTQEFSVLLVDDDPDTQSFFRDALEHHGIELNTASDFGGTFEALDQHIPEVIVLDIFLPDTDGYQLLSKIRSQQITCPVVAITGYYTTDTEGDTLKRGFDGCLLKPIDPQELIAYLRALV